MAEWVEGEITPEFVKDRRAEFDSMDEETRLQRLAEIMHENGITPEELEQFRSLNLAENRAIEANEKTGGLSPYVSKNAMDLYLKRLWVAWLDLNETEDAKRIMQNPRAFFEIVFEMGFDLGNEWATRDK